MPTFQELKEERIKKLGKIKELGWNPYPSSFDKTHSVAQTREVEGQVVKTAGKLHSFRTHGNIAFADLKDETGKIQLFFKKDVLKEAYTHLSLLDIGDYVGVEGPVVKTVAGEISISPTSYTLLSKSLLPLPHEWYGIKDIEQRFRQRYLDLVMNPEVRNRFNTRSKLIRYLREYLDSLGFWEVETPILQSLYGGANAKPFTTHLNALNQQMYLRIAVELYLKRLICGGYERVYEIGKNFRNEGVDRSHNPEFTMIEWYEAYANYHRVMDVTEGLFKYLAQKLNGNTSMKVDEKVIDIAGKWPRIEMTDIIQEKLGLDVEASSEKDLVDYCNKNKIERLGGETKGQLIFSIFEHKIPQLLIEPTWIIDYPEDVSPLSKGHASKPGWVERFEGYVGGKEICDGWSELTDPAIQRERFTKDQSVVRKDKEEAQHIDEDYITAMEYGMPPVGGIGIGIDRLVMFFTNTWAIKETILFPTLKTQELRSKNQEVKISSQKISSLLITRSQAVEVVTSHIKNKNLIKHCLSVEASMKALAKKCGGDENMWGILGLLHDGDWEETQNDPKTHTLKMVEWLKKAGENNNELLQALVSHNYVHTKTNPPETQMEWALYCCDDLTGLIVATSLITPDKKLASVTVESVMKKMKSKSFAANVSREQIMLCQEKLGIPLEEFVGIILHAMQEIHSELGL